MKIIGHTIHTRIPHRGPVSSFAQQQMSIQVDTTLLDECNLALPYAEHGCTSWPIAHRKAAISRAIAVVIGVSRGRRLRELRCRTGSTCTARKSCGCPHRVPGKPDPRSHR